MFVTTATAGRSAATDRSDSSPSTTSQPSPAPGVRAELRHLAADDPARVAARLAQRERDHRRGRRLPVRAGDDDRRGRRDELGEQVGTRPARHARVRGRDEHLPALRAPRAPATPAPRSPRHAPGRGTASRSGPSRRPPRPSRARAARRPTARRRRSRRARCAYPRAGASGISSSAISSAASGFAAARIASPIAASRAPSASSSRTTAGNPRDLRLGHDDHSAGLLEVARVLRLVVVRHVRRRDEHGRLGGGRDLPHRPAGAREREIAGVERRVEVVRPRQQPVVRPRDATLERPGSTARRRGGAPPALPRRTQRARSRSAPPRPGCRRRRAAPSRRPAARIAPAPPRPEPARPAARGARPPGTSARSAPGTPGRPAARTGEASRFASPRCASASDSAAGIRFRQAA